jgi:hypothetical protein
MTPDVKPMLVKIKFLVLSPMSEKQLFPVLLIREIAAIQDQGTPASIQHGLGISSICDLKIILKENTLQIWGSITLVRNGRLLSQGNKKS